MARRSPSRSALHAFLGGDQRLAPDARARCARGAADSGRSAVAVVGWWTAPHRARRTDGGGCASVTARPPSPRRSRARAANADPVIVVEISTGLRQPRLRWGGRRLARALTGASLRRRARRRSTSAAPGGPVSLFFGLGVWTVFDVVQLADGGTAARAGWILWARVTHDTAVARVWRARSHSPGAGRGRWRRSGSRWPVTRRRTPICPWDGCGRQRCAARPGQVASCRAHVRFACPVDGAPGHLYERLPFPSPA